MQFDDANVQTGDLAFSSSDASLPATLSPTVDTTKSWLIYSYDSVSGLPNIGRALVRGVITNSSTLTFDRNNTGDNFDLTWYLVEFTDSTTVQHNTEPFTTTELQRDVTLGAPINLLSSIATGGYHGRGGRSNFATDDDPGVGWFTLDLDELHQSPHQPRHDRRRYRNRGRRLVRHRLRRQRLCSFERDRYLKSDRRHCDR